MFYAHSCHNSNQLLVFTLLSALFFSAQTKSPVISDPVSSACPAVTPSPSLPPPDLPRPPAHLFPIHALVRRATYIPAHFPVCLYALVFQPLFCLTSSQIRFIKHKPMCRHFPMRYIADPQLQSNITRYKIVDWLFSHVH